MTIFQNIDVMNKSNLSVFQMKIHLKGLNESNMLESLVLIKIVSCATLVLCLVEIYIELLKFFLFSLIYSFTKSDLKIDTISEIF